MTGEIKPGTYECAIHGLISVEVRAKHLTFKGLRIINDQAHLARQECAGIPGKTGLHKCPPDCPIRTLYDRTMARMLEINEES